MAGSKLLARTVASHSAAEAAGAPLTACTVSPALSRKYSRPPVPGDAWGGTLGAWGCSLGYMGLQPGLHGVQPGLHGLQPGLHSRRSPSSSAAWEKVTDPSRI